MSRRKRSEHQPAPVDRDEAGGGNSWIVRVAAMFALGQINIALTVIAAFVLGIAGVFLTTAWLFGPKIIREHAEYARFTASADARIVDSWVALELDQSRIQSPEFWRASATATPCVVVDIGGSSAATSDWSAPGRRAFCGTRLAFNASYTLADVRQAAPGVPFAWPRDDHGFVVPEIRIDAATRTWLASHPARKFMHSDWPATSELEWLTIELDRPVDQAVAGWSAPAPVVGLQFDPQHPERPLPTGMVAARRAARPQWLAVAILGGLGIWLWFIGFRLVPQLASLAPQWRWFVMILPLLSLPTWVDTFPRFLQPMSAQWTSVVADLLGDLDPLDRLEATDPSRAVLADGIRLRWIASAGMYRDTFGRVAPPAPPARPLDPNAALIAFSNAVTERVRGLPPNQRAELFGALRRDKQKDLTAAGIVFLAAARQHEHDSSGAPDAAPARAFLEEWFTSPVETPDPHDIAFAARQTLSGR